MSTRQWASDPRPRPNDSFPPTADQVDHCPPHHWLLQGEWQKCRKCGETKQIQESTGAAWLSYRRMNKVAPPKATPAGQTST